MGLASYRDSVSQHGLLPTVARAAYRAANQLTRVAVWRANVLTPGKLNRGHLEDPRRAGGVLVDAAAMRPYAKDPDAWLTDRFLDLASLKGDRCVAFFDGSELLSYAWFSTLPTRLDEVDASLTLHFDPAWVYMYNAFTLPRHRGERLFGIGQALALAEYTKLGYTGLLSYVDSTNYASLKASYRTGYETFGRIVLVKVGKQYVCRATPGCAERGVRVVCASS